MSEVRITKHGYDRIKERFGLPKRAALKLATTALNEGKTISELSGNLRQNLQSHLLKEKYQHGPRTHLVYCKERVFIFVRDDNDAMVLVTCWHVDFRTNLITHEMVGRKESKFKGKNRNFSR